MNCHPPLPALLRLQLKKMRKNMQLARNLLQARFCAVGHTSGYY
jgi:hypothetical protein